MATGTDNDIDPIHFYVESYLDERMHRSHPNYLDWIRSTHAQKLAAHIIEQIGVELAEQIGAGHPVSAGSRYRSSIVAMHTDKFWRIVQREAQKIAAGYPVTLGE